MNVTLFDESIMLGLLTLTGIAFATKFLGSTLTALPKLRSWVRSIRLGNGMVPRGELGLVIASLGLSKGLISQPILYIQAVGMVILTSLITPIILSRLY